MTCDEIENFWMERGRSAAFSAWRKGNKQNLDFPFLTYPLYEDEFSEFLETLEEAGFKKFGFTTLGRGIVQNIIGFLKAGWKLTGVSKFDAGMDDDPFAVDGLIFEKRD